MGWLTRKLTDWFRPWHDDGLPEHLAFGEVESYRLIRVSIARAAAFDLLAGVFGIIGVRYAPRAAQAWLPRERLIMEGISCAHHPITERIRFRRPVPEILKDRFAFLLDHYLRHVGTPWPSEELRGAIERYVTRCE